MSRLRSSYKRFFSVFKGIDLPINRMIPKSFLPPEKTKHYRFLEKYVQDKTEFNPEATDYFQGMIKPPEKTYKGFQKLPSDLSIEPTWWIMPWGGSITIPKQISLSARIARANEHVNKLIAIYESVKLDGYSAWKGGAVSGYILQHPEQGEIFNYIDGHHRIAACSFLSNHNIRNIEHVKVLPIATINRETLLDTPTCKQGIKDGYFTEKDALLLFDNVFNAISERENPADS